MKTECYDVYMTNLPPDRDLDEIIEAGLSFLEIKNVTYETNFTDRYGV